MKNLFFAYIALSVGFAHGAEIGGTTLSSNTTLVDGDTWSAGDLTIDNGVTVNVPTGATLSFTSAANRNLNGGGTLVIDANAFFRHATLTSGDNITVSGANQILNNGTYDFTTGGDLRLSNAGSSFTNNGLLTKTGRDLDNSNGTSNDPTFIFPQSTTTGGAFLNTGDITVDEGHLNIAGGSSTGGNFTTTAGNATLSFSGRWTEITGVADNSAGGTITTSDEDPANTTGDLFVADAATTVLNVTGTGLTFGSGNVDLNGNILRNDGLLAVRGTTNNLPVIIDSGGTGSFVNSSSGTFRLGQGTLTLDAAGLSNEGTLEVNDATGGSTGNRTIIVTGTQGVTNTSGGTVNFLDGTLQLDTTFVNEGTAVLASGTTNQSKVTLSGSTAFENAATGTFRLETGTMTLSGNNIVNNGTMNYDGTSNVTFDGSGRLINNGTFNHVTAGNADNLSLSGTMVFENRGAVTVQDRGDIDLVGAGAVFENHGTLTKTAAGADATFIFRNGTFRAEAGSTVTSQAGTLHFGVDGVADPTASFVADGDNVTTPVLQIAGEWTGTLAGTSEEGGSVQIQYSGNDTVGSTLSVGTGGLALNFGGDGIDWVRQIINTQGETLTNMGLFTITAGNPSISMTNDTENRTLSGGGEFVNASGAVFEHRSGNLTFADDSILRNQGTYQFTSGGVASGFTGPGEFINDTGGSVAHTGGTIDVSGDATFRNRGNFDFTGGFGFSGDGEILNDTNGTFTWTYQGTGTDSFAIATGSNFENDGTFTVTTVGDRRFTSGGTFTNRGTFNHSVTNDANDNMGTTGGTLFLNSGTFNLTDNGDWVMEGDSTFRIASGGILKKSGTSNEPSQFLSFESTGGNGEGTFDNQGTVEVTGGVLRVADDASSAQFDAVTLVQNDGSGGLTGGDWIANSTATGTAQIDLDAFGTASGITRIGAGANVELTGAGATLVQLSSLSTVDGGLYVNGGQNFTPPGFLSVGTTGTLGGDGTVANTTTIDGMLLPGTTRGAETGTLSFGADLIFNPTGSTSLGLLAPTGTVNGTLDSAAMAAAILALGDLNPSALTHDSLSVTGTVSLNPSMTFNVVDLGAIFAAGQFFDLLDFTTLSGVSEGDLSTMLSLPATPGLVWETDLFRSDGILYLSVPEPSRLMLVGLAACFWMARRRR